MCLYHYAFITCGGFSFICVYLPCKRSSNLQ
nr:MAG TPA: hypothetical protein [Caudoviricetes sp.]